MDNVQRIFEVIKCFLHTDVVGFQGINLKVHLDDPVTDFVFPMFHILNTLFCEFKTS